MAGYAGYSKSNNAIEAESEGRMPMSRACAVVASATGLKRADAKALLVRLHDGEYHHTSKFYNRVKFYDTVEAIRHHELSLLASRLPANWRAPLDAARRHVNNDPRSFDERSAQIAANDDAHAKALGVSVTDLIDAYYSL